MKINKDLNTILQKSEYDKQDNMRSILKSAWERLSTDQEKIQIQIEALLQTATKEGYKLEYAECLLILAKYKLDYDEIQQAKSMLDSAFEIFTAENNMIGLIRTRRLYSTYYYNIGNLERNLEICFSSLNIIKENHLNILENGHSIEACFLNNIAAIYEQNGRYQDAINFFQMTYELIKNTDSYFTALLLCNISESYIEMNVPQAALKYCNESLEVASKNNLSPNIFSFCYHCYGLIHKQLGDLNKAIDCFQEAVIYAQRGQRKNFQVDSLVKLGELYFITNDLINSRKYLEQALEIAESIEANVWMIELHNLLGEAYEKSGDITKALYHNKKHIQLYKEVMPRELQHKIEHYSNELKIEGAKKDAEIHRLKNVELKLKNDEIEQKAKEIEESYRGITVISEIGQKITSSLNLDEVLNAIYENVKSLMKLNIMGIGFFDENTGDIDYKMFIEEGIRLPEFYSNINTEVTLASKCIQTCKEVFICDMPEAEVRKGPNTTHITPRSIIYYPLILKDKVIGVFTVQSYEQHAYSNRNLEAIKALASYIAIAINNSQKSEALHDMIRELEISSTTDTLTGLYNRRYMNEKIISEFSSSIRTESNLSILLTDIDYFKVINDNYGHECGDFILKEISSIFNSFIRKNDYASRWGGEEFLILLTDTDAKKSEIIAERLREHIQNYIFKYNHQMIKITMTFGIAQFHKDLSIDDIIRRADQALYWGKHNGRNKVHIYNE